MADNSVRTPGVGETIATYEVIGTGKFQAFVPGSMSGGVGTWAFTRYSVSNPQAFRLSDGAAFVDARDPVDRVGRLLGVVTIDAPSLAALESVDLNTTTLGLLDTAAKAVQGDPTAQTPAVNTNQYYLRQINNKLAKVATEDTLAKLVAKPAPRPYSGTLLHR